LVFAVCVFLVSLPACGYFFTLQVPMLQQRGYPAPLALTSLNQFSELIFMFSMPWFVARLGLKWVVAIGMAAWGLRYLCFTCPDFSAALVGLILHGFCYSFFYVGSYMYFDKRAPAELKSSAQSLVTFLLVGVGMFVGSKAGGFMMERFPAPVRNMAAALGTDATKDPRPLPPWNDPDAATSAWRYLDLTGTVAGLLYGEQPKPAEPDLAAKLDADNDGTITMAEVKEMPTEGLTFGGHSYSRDDIAAVFRKIDGGTVTEDQIKLDRKGWLAAQSCDWQPIWWWPGIGVFVMLVLFAAAFRDQPKVEQPKE
jgi:uncharacterized membrane protein YGL010W